MDGLEFFKRIQETNTHCIKILITAYGNQEVVSGAMGLGIHDYIEKPFTTKTIETSLSRIFMSSHGEDKESFSKNPG